MNYFILLIGPNRTNIDDLPKSHYHTRLPLKIYLTRMILEIVPIVVYLVDQHDLIEFNTQF